MAADQPTHSCVREARTAARHSKTVRRPSLDSWRPCVCILGWAATPLWRSSDSIRLQFMRAPCNAWGRRNGIWPRLHPRDSFFFDVFHWDGMEDRGCPGVGFCGVGATWRREDGRGVLTAEGACLCMWRMREEELKLGLGCRSCRVLGWCTLTGWPAAFVAWVSWLTRLPLGLPRGGQK